MLFKRIRALTGSLRGQLFLLLATLVVPVLLVQSAIYIHWYRAQYAQETHENLVAARALAQAFRAYAEGVANQERAIGNAIVLSSLSGEAANRYLNACKEKDPLVSGFVWLSKEGKCLASSEPKPLNLQYADNSYFQEIVQGREWAVSNLVDGEATNQPVFAVARGIVVDGALTGVLVASFDLDRIEELWKASSPPGGFVTLVDRQGMLVSISPSIPVADRDWTNDDPLLVQALGGREQTGVFTSPIDKTRLFSAWVPIPDIGWVAGASRPLSAVMKPLYRSLLLGSSLMCLSVAVSVLLSLVVYVKFQRRMRELLDRALAIGLGDLEPRNQPSGIAEFGQLSEGINLMAEALRRARGELEFRVEERTEKLRLANASLQREITGREKAQQIMLEQSRILEAFYEHSLSPLVFLDKEFNFIRVNEAYARTCQRPASEFPGHNHFEFYPSEELEGKFREVVRTKVPYHVLARPFTFPNHPDWGTSFWNLSVWPLLDRAGEVEFLVFSLEDVTARTLARQRALVVQEVHSLFTTKSSRKEYLDSIVRLIQGVTGCENVGIRVVDEQRNAPYEAFSGFSPEFMVLENWLNLDRDACACTRIIRGNPEDTDRPSMTPFGSFRLENSRTWLDGLTLAQRERYRGNCITSGFATVVVVPVRFRNEPAGAIHITDTRPGKVPLADVEFIESLAPLIGEAIHRFTVEEDLRKASRYARGLIETSLDPLVTVSPEGVITDVNRATERVTGISREKLIGSEFSNYFTEPDEARKSYRQVLAEGQVTDYPLTIRHVSGEMTDVLYNATVYRNEAGEIQGVFAAARDITRRKRDEEELRQYRDHLEDLVKERTAELAEANQQQHREMADRETAQQEMRVLARFASENPSPVLRISAEHVLVYANAASEPMLTLWQCRVGDNVPGDVWEKAAATLLSHETLDVELLADRHVFLMSFSPVIEAGYVNIYGRDITERTQMEKDLRLARDELEQRVRERTAELIESNLALTRAIQENVQTLEALRMSQANLADAQRMAHMGSWDWNMATSDLMCSDEVFRIFGYEPRTEPPTTKEFFDSIHPDDRQRVEDWIREAVANTQAFDINHRVVLPSGEVRTVHERGEVTCDEKGAPRRIFGMVVDITDRLRAEEEAKVRQQQLVQADKMVSLGILVSGVAHEINNPNHSIMSNVALLADVWEEAQPILEGYYRDNGDYVIGGFDYSESREKLPEMFSSILTNSKRIEVIVNELRDFARYSPKETMAAVDINSVVKSANILVSNMIRKFTDRFSIEYGMRIPPVLGNFQRIEQVVINLIQNACHALPGRDHGIQINTRYAADTGLVLVEVHDEGGGIPEGDLKHLGDPFFTTKRGTGGMGLGLWISFNIIHEHGGTLMYTSAPGEGTTAKISLPIDERTRQNIEKMVEG